MVPARWFRLERAGGDDAPLPAPTARLDVPCEGLRLLDRDVGVRDEGDQLVRGVASDQPLRTPVIGEPDLVHRPLVAPPAHREGLYPVRDQHPALDLGPRSADGGPVPVLQTLFRGQLWRDLAEHLRL